MTIPPILSSPVIWKFVAIVAIAGALFTSGCQYGQSDSEAKLAALQAGYEEAFKQARANARKEELRFTEAVVRENARNEKAYADNISIYDAKLERLRRAANSAGRGGSVPRTPITTAYCLGASGPTREELLGYGTTVAGILREATADRAALESCIAAWPR